MAKKHFVRREPCPTCRKGLVAVTYEQVIDGGGNVTREAPIRAAGCRTPGCASQWFNAGAKRGDANQAAAEPVGEATERK